MARSRNEDSEPKKKREPRELCSGCGRPMPKPKALTAEQRAELEKKKEQLAIKLRAMEATLETSFEPEDDDE